MTGELRRAFMKHVKYGVVKVVEYDETGMALAAIEVNEATACRHQIEDYPLALDPAVEINEHKRDWEKYEPACSDPAHLLNEIGKLEMACQQAEGEYEQAKSHAKSMKEVYEQHTNSLRMLVRDATSPRKMPLFDKPAA